MLLLIYNSMLSIHFIATVCYFILLLLHVIYIYIYMSIYIYYMLLYLCFTSYITSPNIYYHIRVLTKNFGMMTFLRHLGKSVTEKAYSLATRQTKYSWRSAGRSGVGSPAGPGQSTGAGSGAIKFLGILF